MANATTGAQAATPSTMDWTDPREQVEFSVRFANGRLAGRRFSSREEAEAWVDRDAGEDVVSFNPVCDCEM